MARAIAFDTGAIREATATAIDGDVMLKRSPDSAAMVAYWDMVDAITEGYAAVKAAGEKYLPKFNDETPEDYKTRLEITKFTNIYRDIVEALAAKPFEKEISLVKSEKSTDAPQEIVDFLENVDGSGNTLTVFGALTFFNGINSAIDWIFVDYPNLTDDTRPRNRAEEKARGIQPFWSHVLGRNVLEARTSIINGNEALTYIRIFEPGNGTPDHVRVFERDDNGMISWKLYVKAEKPNADGKTQFVLENEGILSIDVIPLVPFATGRRDGRTFKFFPAMQDAADLQIKLYQAESALEFVSTMAGYPMLAANGMLPELDPATNKPKKLRVGPSKVLYSKPDARGNVGSWAYVEPAATSMEFLQKKIDKTKEDLRELGRQPLTATSGNLTVITTAVAAGKAKSAVAAWANALKNTFEEALIITCKFWSITKEQYDPQVSVYDEFDNFTENGRDLDALRAARDNGDLSQETYWAELKRRKVLSNEFDAEVERERILNEIPGEVDLENSDDNPAPRPGNDA